ncbi:MAG: hypothetical protein H0U03_12770 [Actinobacteria bacterium]|nr:hypothetical protein [Actinomycetota bacterium]
MELKGLASLLVGLVAAGSIAAAVGPKPTDYVASRQQPDGGFAERGGGSDPTLTAWAVLGLQAAGRNPAASRRDGASALEYLADKPYPAATDLALRVLALRALGQGAEPLSARLVELRRPDGRIGPLVNSTIWGVLALRAAGRPAGAASVRYLLRQQRPSGGWGWAPGGAADSNDTAAAIQALRAAGITGKPVRRGLLYLRRLQTRDGGFALARGRPADSQSTAWSIQAFVAAGEPAPAKALRFLERMRRADGSFRYSARYVTTPTMVTAQVLPALARKPFPLR